VFSWVWACRQGEAGGRGPSPFVCARLNWPWAFLPVCYSNTRQHQVNLIFPPLTPFPWLRCVRCRRAACQLTESDPTLLFVDRLDRPERKPDCTSLVCCPGLYLSACLSGGVLFGIDGWLLVARRLVSSSFLPAWGGRGIMQALILVPLGIRPLLQYSSTRQRDVTPPFTHLPLRTCPTTHLSIHPSASVLEASTGTASSRCTPSSGCSSGLVRKLTD